MATAAVVLTTTPQQVSSGTSGVRIQSHKYKFKWVASTSQPTDLSIFHLDSDVYIEGKGAIWAWQDLGTTGTVIVT
ncbi:hypothetical protein P255_00975 [Acinetobacter brisouii CIP 110357]|uniref:Uncharacterized protein n=1 Tax=Acinetobacter brisouii CIP 110357 TaxID=1341683 RepID=V2UTB9_9GAMM|nr:hypothetical protein [Acinetobacter brisouii]ENV48096.1 hypothetical protein F954_01163 [Acinetobacter brisouii ANC 4119]ESK51880.1 hypothetical protein P255_00975 [Acinetobacter brisouii CIP 110357]